MQQKQYSYTFIIPHFNIPVLLIRCLKSIPEREDIQVIVVDDCSPNVDLYHDQYPEIFSHKNLEFYSTEKGGSAGRARNIGLSHAQGKWLIFADSDDMFAENVCQIMDQYYEQDYDVIYFASATVDNETLRPVENRMTAIVNGIKLNNLDQMRYGNYVPWAKLIKRSVVVENHIYYDETIVCNDAMFSIKLGHFAKEIKCDPTVIYISTVREGSLFYGVSKERIQIRYEVKKRINQQLAKWQQRKSKPLMIHEVQSLKKISYSIYLRELFCCLEGQPLNMLLFDLKRTFLYILKSPFRAILK